MILLCNIHNNTQNLKLAFCTQDIEWDGSIYSAHSHREQPSFFMHHDTGIEQVILRIKPMTDIFFQNGQIIFYRYDENNAQSFLEADIHNIRVDSEGVNIICHSQKSHFKRRIGRLYSDIL